MARTADPLTSLQRKLGYKFRDKALLKQALTHASARVGGGTGDNERLEFLGDRVLGLAIAEMLCDAYPEANEGELARQFNRLVQRETCAEVAVNMVLGDYLRLSGSELTSGGRGKASILADACEAVLGAIFIDTGFDATRDIVRKFWEPKLAAGKEAPRDPKTALQEWAQGRKLGLPNYAQIERAGPDHAPNFTSEVRVGAVRPARGQGPSKRLAEQEAALALLRREGIWEYAGE